MPLLTGDVGELLRQCAAGALSARPTASAGATVALVLAAPGYPESPRHDVPIHGVERAASLPGVLVFQAGTRESPEGLVTAGGRALTVSATAATREEARERAYAALACIQLEGGLWRRDIAGPGLLLERKSSG